MTRIQRKHVVKIAKQLKFIFIKLCKNYIELKINMCYNRVMVFNKNDKNNPI